MARRSLVLLRNDGTLPLVGGLLPTQTVGPPRTGMGRTVASWARTPTTPMPMLGDWAGASGQVDWMPDGHPREATTTVLDGFRAIAPAGWTVTHARGADIGRAGSRPGWSDLPGRPAPAAGCSSRPRMNPTMLARGRPRCPGGGLASSPCSATRSP